MNLVFSADKIDNAFFQSKNTWFEGHHVVILEKVEFFNFVNLYVAIQHLIKNKEQIIFVNFFIRNTKDLDVLQQFINFSADERNTSHWIYYSPRPNDFFSTEKTALIFCPNLAVYKKAAEKIGYYQNKFIFLAYKFLVKIKNRLKFFKLNKVKSSSHIDQNMALVKESLPNDISQWPVLWHIWQAPYSIKYYHLIENVQEFFPHPRGIHVILSNYCNLKCVMCPYHSPVYKAHHTNDYFDSSKAMSFDVFKKIADYAGANNVALQFGQIEEPLLFKNIYDYIKYATEVGVKHIHITTNGTPLNSNNIQRLIKSGVTSLMVSLDAVDADTYKRIRGTDLKKVEANLQKLIPLAKKSGIKTWASFILQDQPQNERDDFLKKWTDLGVDNITFYVLTDHDKKTGAFIRSKEHYIKGDRYPCASPWLQSVVFPKGEVSLCCKSMTDVGWRGVVSVGDLMTKTFEEIWTGEKYGLVRKELLLNNFDVFKICENCDIWSSATYKTEETDRHKRSYNETMDVYTLKETI